MAKKADPPDEVEEREQVLAGLRRALDGQPRLLQGPAAKGALFPGGKAGAAPAAKALAEGYLAETDPPAGVRKTRAAKYVRLTDKGREFLREQDRPRKLLEELLPIVRRLAARLEDTADSLREVMNVLEGTLIAPQEVPLPAEGAAPESSEPAVAEPAEPAEPPSTPPGPGSLERALRAAYDKLCLFVEFHDGVVELLRLYQEVRKKVPDLTVEEYHRTLLSLWSRQAIRLHVLNEVGSAADPGLGIWHNERFYYFVSWRQ